MGTILSFLKAFGLLIFYLVTKRKTEEDIERENKLQALEAANQALEELNKETHEIDKIRKQIPNDWSLIGPDGVPKASKNKMPATAKARLR